MVVRKKHQADQEQHSGRAGEGKGEGGQWGMLDWVNRACTTTAVVESVTGPVELLVVQIGCLLTRNGLRPAGQHALAYVTAKTHGMEEEGAALAEEIGEGSLPQVSGDASLLMPPTPILREDNWPLLTVSKGFFENLAQQGAWCHIANVLTWTQTSL